MFKKEYVKSANQTRLITNIFLDAAISANIDDV